MNLIYLDFINLTNDLEILIENEVSNESRSLLFQIKKLQYKTTWYINDSIY